MSSKFFISFVLRKGLQLIVNILKIPVAFAFTFIGAKEISFVNVEAALQKEEK